MQQKIFLVIAMMLFSICPAYGDSQIIDSKVIINTEKFFNTVKTITANFIQISDGEQTGSGKFYINRPEQKMKWEYIDPSPIDIIFQKENVIYFDKQLDEVSRTSLEDSLLTILTTHRDIFHSAEVKITKAMQVKDRYEITMLRPDKKDEPELTLIMQKNPVSLQSIIIKDKDHRLTEIKLSSTEYNGEIDNKIFRLNREFLKRR